DLSELETYRREFRKSCYVCAREDATFERYLDAFFSLYKKEPEFREQVLNNKGYCLDHFMLIYDMAGDKLSKEEAETFRSKLASLEDARLTELEDDVEWFTKKFDYRFAKEPWKNSRDALPRCIQKVNSQFAEKK
ncbi:MAG: hypothetical protein HUJ69_03095, partial [Lachnospiraceae bacterium]|nr:hypothetical protein [Lachnospiraceae bacterium]